MLRPAGPLVDPVPCSGCGRSIDPLRTAHAAIFDARVHYFCARTCRARFLGEQPSPTPPEPRVSEEARRAQADTQPVVDAFVPEPDGAALPEPAVTSDDLSLLEPIPRGVTSEPLASAELAALEEREIGGLLLVIAVVSGALAVVLTLAGPTRLVLGARVVLSAVGAAMLLGRAATTERDVTDPSPAPHLLGIAAALVVAGWAAFGVDRSLASEAASLAGILVVCAAVAAWLVEVARSAVALEREAVAVALSKPSYRVGEAGELERTTELAVGEKFVVEPGDVVPVDAVVESGDVEVLPWLGAATPVRKARGDVLVAGATVVADVGRTGVVATAVHVGHDRAYARILLDPRRRADALASVPRTGRALAERWSIVAGIVGGILATLLRRSPAEIALTALAIHASLATGTVAIVAGVHVARGVLVSLRRGIVFRSADAWERAGQINVGVFSARGTLLLGEPELAEVEPFPVPTLAQRGAPSKQTLLAPDALLALAAGAERGERHPIATALVRACLARGKKPESVRNAASVPGLGVRALTQAGEEVLVGNRALLLSSGVAMALAEARVSELEALGRTVVMVAVGGRLVGIVGLQDGIRPGARAAVQHLFDARIEPVLLSGDSRDTCEAIARSLDIEHVRPDVPPGERAAEVKRLLEAGLRVAVLGHAGADDDALGAAEVSVVLGGAGKTDHDVTLAWDDIRDGAFALALAARNRFEARLGLALSVGPSMLAAVIVGVGVLPPVFAPLAALLGGVIAVLHVRSVEGRTSTV